MNNFKKFTVALAIVALTAGTALAYGPGKGGKGQGCLQNIDCPNKGQGYQQNGDCPNKGQGMKGKGKGSGKNGKGGFGNSAEIKEISQDDATKQFSEYATANLKGFDVQSVEAFEGRRGTGYTAKLTDANENTFLLRLTPFGDIRGPFVQK